MLLWLQQRANRNLLALLGAVLIPMGALLKFHLDLKPTRDGKARMLLNMGSTFAATLASLTWLHQGILFKRGFWKQPTRQVVGPLLGVATLPVASFWGTRRLAKVWFPKPAPVASFSSTPYTPLRRSMVFPPG